MAIKGKSEIIIKDTGEAKLRKEMKNLDGSFVTIGVHSDAGQYEDGTDVGAVAFWNEFGTKTIPERSFLRGTIAANQSLLDKMREEWSLKLITGRATAEKSLEAMGFIIQELVRGRINTSNDWAEPNAPSTAAAKLKGGALRGATPLIKTGLLLRSIKSKVTIK